MMIWIAKSIYIIGYDSYKRTRIHFHGIPSSKPQFGCFFILFVYVGEPGKYFCNTFRKGNFRTIFHKLYFLVSFHHTEQGGVAHTLKPPPITKCQFSAKSPRPGAHGFITSAQLPLRTSIRVYPSGVRINAYLPQRKEIVSAFCVCR